VKKGNKTKNVACKMDGNSCFQYFFDLILKYLTMEIKFRHHYLVAESQGSLLSGHLADLTHETTDFHVKMCNIFIRAVKCTPPLTLGLSCVVIGSLDSEFNLEHFKTNNVW
jgi:hypothetical protein